VKPAAFIYERADSLAEAIAGLSELGDEAKLLAGGQSLVPMMNFRLVRPTALLDLNPVWELRHLDREPEELRVGAMTRHVELEDASAALVADGFELLPAAARFVGHMPIRSRGTFGGSVAHSDPSSEWCMLCAALDATIVAEGPAGARQIAAADFFTGFFSNSLAEGEILTEVRLPRRGSGASIQEFARRHGDFALVATIAVLDMDGEVCRSARLVVGGVDEIPVRVRAAEAILTGARVDREAVAEAAQAAAREVEPSADIHATAEYRRNLTSVLIGRAIEEAAGRGR
jgi:carbon-monoxide dehydrogenase medium subunit